jgi:hypothetical protein
MKITAYSTCIQYIHTNVMRTISLRSHTAVIFDGLELLDGSGLVVLVDQTERRKDAHEPLMRQLDLPTRHSYRVYVFVYVRMYVCVYVCVYVCMYVCAYIHVYVRMCACRCMCMCVCAYVSICMCACVHVCAYVCMYVDMHGCVHVCIHCMYTCAKYVCA